ncbi:MAG: hypothetical protein CSB06_02140 [Bacteroidia bacterium]|nr:MAG: hypothetical protein CSB06_02140 [Bacteroidia bacterium]
MITFVLFFSRMLIDIHTHKKDAPHLALQNRFPEEIEAILPRGNYSLGLHPWKLAAADIAERINKVEKNMGRKNIRAVGETGMDKYRPAFALQKEVFLAHWVIAHKHDKPIIVHCVKAYSELLEIAKNNPPTVPLILHRYSGNMTLAKQLDHLDCYFSFGQDLFHEKNKAASIFMNLPLERIFLETDDSHFSIKEIYQQAAKLRQTSLENIESQLENNFRNCFKINDLQNI